MAGSPYVVLWMVLIAFAAAAVAPLLHRALRSQAATLLALVPAALVAWVVIQLPTDGEVWTQAWTWIPSLNIALAFRLDGLAAVFALLICGIGALILLYAGGYMHDDPQLGRLCALLLFFLGSMLGVVLSDDLFVLFIFWELTSVASYLLIGFKHEKLAARDAARQALLVTGAGGLALLAGLILLVMAAVQAGVDPTQATRISHLLTQHLPHDGLFTAALLLIVVGAFSKSAQMPLHFWLPNAMAAPTPVSAYLHSATMVKAGVFLLARLNPLFADAVLWHVLLTVVGAVTMLVAAMLAAGQTDLKRILAYTTVSVLGTLTMLLGVGTAYAIKAMVVYLVAHACYKAALFMIAGTLEHATGTRDVSRLGGLARAMPLTAASGMLAALSMAGAPPLFGFIGKELLLKAKLDLDMLGNVLIVVATLANIFLIAMALVVAVWPFFRRRPDESIHGHEAPPRMLAGPLILAVTGLFVGVIPDVFDRVLGTAMASAIGGRTIVMELKLWHGLSPVALTAMAISAVTLGLGFALFLKLRKWIDPIATVVGRLGQVGPARLYDLTLRGLFALADAVMRHTQTGSLRRYVRIILLTFVALLLYPVLRALPLADTMTIELKWHELVVVALTLCGALGALATRSRLAAIALLGLTGLLIAVIFALFSAPDLALTQIMVEALTVILLVLIFYRLPRAARPGAFWPRVADATLAGAAGALMTMLVLVSATLHLPPSVSAQLTAMSKPLAYGRNVVNVILVDFRALDTLGEITVVAIAAVGVYALIKVFRRGRRAEDAV